MGASSESRGNAPPLVFASLRGVPGVSSRILSLQCASTASVPPQISQSLHAGRTVPGPTKLQNSPFAGRKLLGFPTPGGGWFQQGLTLCGGRFNGVGPWRPDGFRERGGSLDGFKGRRHE